MPYTFVERQRIHRRAKKLVGLKKQDTPQDKMDFMQECLLDMASSGETDPNDARDVCELLWEELQQMD